MEGGYNGYLPYGPGQQSQQHQQQQQQQQQQQNLGSFGSLAAQNGHQDNSSHPTLPPLQGQNGGFSQFGSLSFPNSQAQASSAPHTPSTSMQQHGANGYSTMSPAHQQGNMMPPSFSHGYGMPQSMMYQTSSGSTMPSTTSAAGLPSLRPMPPGGVGSGPLNGLPSMNSNGQLSQQPSFPQNEEAPTHVVGSQGRRGILPSAPGRPQPAPVGSVAASTKSMIPQKDADGKYPCPHCNKTYLHAKHLKRHLLRHTGDRPYMCHLCKDTFSRSDILKRHFQKCSIRRGNPTGANHLAHQRRNTNSGNRLSISQQDGPIGLAGLADVAGQPYPGGVVASSPTVNGDMSGRSSRANSLITPTNISNRNSIAGLGILSSNAPGDDHMVSSAGYQQSLPAYAMHNASNGGHVQNSYVYPTPNINGNAYNSNAQHMSFLGQQGSRFDNSHSNSPHQQTANGDDWSRMFNPGGQDGFIGNSQPANASSQGMARIKTENDGDAKHEFGGMHNDMNNESFLGI